VIRIEKKEYRGWNTVLIRSGTSRTGITAMSFSVAASMADTGRAPEFETKTVLLSGVKVMHSGTEPLGGFPGE
jgi:hypothetical protein